MFAADRISRVEPVLTRGAHFKYPREDDWSPEEFTERSFGIFTPPESAQEAIDVALVFEDIAWLKAHVRERRWARGQRFTELPDGRLRMEFTVNSLIEVLPWVRQWGENVRVEKPDHLIEDLRRAERVT